MLGFSIVLFAAVYAVAVLTPMGQALENAALRGTDQASAADSGEACEGLGDITVWALSIATAVIGPIALLLRKVLLAFVAVGVIAGGQVTPPKRSNALSCCGQK